MSRVLRFQSGDDDGRLGEEKIRTVQDKSESVLARNLRSSEVASRPNVSLKVHVGIRGDQSVPVGSRGGGRVAVDRGRVKLALDEKLGSLSKKEVQDESAS